MPIHNQLKLISVRLKNVVLMDSTRPIPKNKYLGACEFEPRWFKIGVAATNGNYCALEEWIDATNQEKHHRHIVVFDSQTGEEVTDKLTRPLNECSELEQSNPVLKE